MGLAARGSRNMDDGEEKIEDSELRRLLRRRAMKVYLESVAMGVVLTVAVFLL